MPPISSQLNSFSPLAQSAFLSNLGLNDRNGNGVIDKDAGEGYEQFTAKYGNADIGFFANGITQGAHNNKLEENEIVNHYYLNIRFKDIFTTETNAVENDLAAEIRRSGIQLVWLDDEQGTVMNAVSRILGAGWQGKNVSADEAERMFQRVMESLRVNGLTGDPSRTGYYQLPEFVRRKAGYCFEAAQFGFWFFSQLEINSVAVDTMLTKSIQHEALKLISANKIIDHFGMSTNYAISINQWIITNPLQSISNYYFTKAESQNSISSAEQAAINNRYDLQAITLLIEAYFNTPNPDYHEIISLGEFMLDNIDIEKVMSSRDLKAAEIQANLERTLVNLIISYSTVRNHTGFNKIANLLKRYFSHDPGVKPFLERYKF